MDRYTPAENIINPINKHAVTFFIFSSYKAFLILPCRFAAARPSPVAVLLVPGSFSVHFSSQQGDPYDLRDSAIDFSAAVPSVATGSYSK